MKTTISEIKLSETGFVNLKISVEFYSKDLLEIILFIKNNPGYLSGEVVNELTKKIKNDSCLRIRLGDCLDKLYKEKRAFILSENRDIAEAVSGRKDMGIPPA